MLLLPEVRTGETQEPSKKATLFPELGTTGLQSALTFLLERFSYVICN
jgi:hypothetical protein